MTFDCVHTQQEYDGVTFDCAHTRTESDSVTFDCAHRLYFAKETYDSKEPTNRGHPISLGHVRNQKIIGLFCKRALQKRLYSAKETSH